VRRAELEFGRQECLPHDMARMLQALKNLEAKSPSKTATKPKTIPAPVVQRIVERPVPQPTSIPVSPAVTESIDALVGHLASLEIAVQDPPGRFELGQVSATPFLPPATPTVPPATNSPDGPAAAIIAKPPETLAQPSRMMCEVERLVRRTLSDPVRARPLAELANRLRQDMQQTSAKSLAFVGVGQSATYEVLLYAATLLAEQASGKVLLIDADFAQRRLSDALEFGRDRGLCELLGTDISGDDLSRQTAVEKLMLLPVGLSNINVAAVGPRWGKILEQLTASSDCALIDVGAASGSAAATLARTADATYLVVQLGTVEASEAQKALADFRSAGARVLGCIAT